MNIIHHIRRALVCMILCVLLCVSAVAQPASTADFYNSLIGLPAQTLYERAASYRQSDHTIDSAVVCYRVLENRLGQTSDTETIELCIKALAEMAYIHYFYYYDYPQAFSNMIKAEELANQYHLTIPVIPLYYGLMYASISQQSMDDRSAQTAMQYLRQAFHEAQDLKEAHQANLAYSNLVNLTYMFSEMDSIADVHERFMAETSTNPDNQYYTTFNLRLFDGLKAMQAADTQTAISAFEDIQQITPIEEKYSRYLIGTWQYKAIAHERNADYAKAINCLEEGLKVARQYNIKDAQIELYRQLAGDAAKLQRNEDKYRYQNEYLALKDSVLNYQQVASIDEVRFLGEMRKAETEIQEIEAQHRRLQWYLLMGAVLILIFLGWFYALYVKNRQLRRSNESLYRKNVEVMKAEESERKARARYQTELDQLRQKFEETATTTSPDQAQVKYKGSKLKDHEKEDLADKIRQVMETSPEIYSVNFSAERLAAILEMNYKYVSQTINEVYGYNFNTLLNNYRIREACRRISDKEHYGNLTLEALSLSVGFKSRSTFVLQFKRVTGLTPSQYLTEAGKDSDDLAAF